MVDNFELFRFCKFSTSQSLALFTFSSISIGDRIYSYTDVCHANFFSSTSYAVELEIHISSFHFVSSMKLVSDRYMCIFAKINDSSFVSGHIFADRRGSLVVLLFKSHRVRRHILLHSAEEG